MKKQEIKKKFILSLKDGYSLVEVITAIAIFTIFFTSLLFCYSSIIKLEIKSKEKIYRGVEVTNEISKKYYTNTAE